MASNNDLENNEKWDNYEVYKGPKEADLPIWLNKIVATIFAIVGLFVVFCICGGLLFISFYGRTGRLLFGDFIINEPVSFAVARFLIGGSLGVFVVLFWWWRSNSQDG